MFWNELTLFKNKARMKTKKYCKVDVAQHEKLNLKHYMNRLAYLDDLSDKEWKQIEPILKQIHIEMLALGVIQRVSLSKQRCG